MNDRNEDFDLVRKFLEGDESSFNRLVHKYQQRIYWHARRMSGSHLDADEIVQVVLLVMYRKLKTFKFGAALYTWIYRITSTRSLNFIKRKNLRSFFSIDDKEVQEIGSEDIISDMEKKEKLEMISAYLQKLPPKQREVFIFRNYDDMPYEEIAKITGKSVGGLKANYFQAVKKMMELVNEKN